MINSDRNSRRVIVIALLCALMTPLFADAGRRPSIRVEMVPGDEASGPVARVVREALTLRLERRGIATDATDPEIAVRGVSTLVGANVRIELELFAVDTVRGGAPTDARFEAVGVFPIDINLDRAVARLVDDLLDMASSLLDAIADRQEQAVRERDPVPADSPRIESRVEASGGKPVRRVHVGVVAGFSPLVPTLDAARYLGPSVGASMLVVWFPGGREGLAVGVTGRYVTAQATGVATSARLSIIPFGLSIGAATSGAPVSPFGRVAVGMAMFSSDHPVLGALQSLLPWSAAELGIRFSFGFARLELGAGAEAYLDGNTLLVAFVPTVAAGVVF